MLDIDHFKAFNDSYGHDVGDMILREVTKVVSLRLRHTDYFGRWGGEEFFIIVPETRADSAAIFTERIRSEMTETVFSGGHNVTCSFGVAELKEAETLESLVKRVDNALYEAKETGRNKVCLAKD